MKTYAVLGLFVAAFFLNPALACSSGSDSGPTFSEAEMRAAVAGTYVGTLPGTDETVTLTLDEAVAASTSTTQSTRRTQCSNRSFIRPAAACIDQTTMTLSGTLVSSAGTVAKTTLKGDFLVYSLDLTNGWVDLDTASGGTLYASYDSEMGASDWEYTAPGETTAITLSLSRVP